MTKQAPAPTSTQRDSPRRRKLKRLWPWLLLATLVTGELTARGLVIYLDRRPLLRRDPVTGWGPRRNLDEVFAYRGGAFGISTDERGHRLTAPTSATREQPSILVVGDSFAQGLGVGDAQTFAWLLSESTNRAVTNLGVLGYNSFQELASLRRHIDQDPQAEVGDVVVLIFDNDLIDARLSPAPDIGRTRPLLGEDYANSWLDTVMDKSTLFWLLSGRLSALRTPSELHPEQGIETVAACIDAMRALSAQSGARCHVLAYRRLTGSEVVSEEVWDQLLERCAATDLSPHVQAGGGENLVGFDGLHWNAAGHRLVADVLLQLLGP